MKETNKVQEKRKRGMEKTLWVIKEGFSEEVTY